jgi:hypothetical protein
MRAFVCTLSYVQETTSHITLVHFAQSPKAVTYRASQLHDAKTSVPVHTA